MRELIRLREIICSFLNWKDDGLWQVVEDEVQLANWDDIQANCCIFIGSEKDCHEFVENSRVQSRSQQSRCSTASE